MEIASFRHDGVTEVFSTNESTDDIGCSMEVTISTYEPNATVPSEVNTFTFVQSYDDGYYSYNAAENFEMMVQNEPETTERMVDAIKAGCVYNAVIDDWDDVAVAIAAERIR